MLTFLSNLKLTATQWLIASMATIIGILVVSLRLQGNKLHSTQVDLLRQKFLNQMDLQDAKVEAAKAAYIKAQNAYEGNKP